MASHPDRGLRWGVPLAAPDPMASPTGPPMAGLDLQVQTDRYCIYQVWFLFFVSYQIPSLVTAGRRSTGCGGAGQGEGRKELTPKAGVQERGTSGSFGKKEGVPRGREGASLGVGEQYDPEPEERQPA